MASVFDVAKYILQKMGRLSTWKLQKLCYYSQAWQLAWTGKSLFSEEFEAWSNGPVCKELFHAHKGRYSVVADDLYCGNANNLSADQKEAIDKVLDGYGNMMPYELREQTHFEEPWKIARGNCKEGEPCSNIVTKSSMGEFYGSL